MAYRRRARDCVLAFLLRNRGPKHGLQASKQRLHFLLHSLDGCLARSTCCWTSESLAGWFEAPAIPP